MVLLALVVMGAAPSVGSTWRVVLDESIQAQFSSNQGELETQSIAAGANTVDLKVLEVSEGRPTRLGLSVVRSAAHEFQYSSEPITLSLNYGEPVLQGGPLGRPDSQVGSIRQLLKSLISPDPVVAAVAAATSPCSSEAGQAIGVAAAALVNQASNGGRLRVVDGASATCVKGTRTWKVRFSLLQERSTDLTIAYSGTVSVPVGAWRSNLDLRGTYQFKPTGSLIELKGKGSVVFTSSTSAH